MLELIKKIVEAIEKTKKSNMHIYINGEKVLTRKNVTGARLDYNLNCEKVIYIFNKFDICGEKVESNIAIYENSGISKLEFESIENETIEVVNIEQLF